MLDLLSEKNLRKNHKFWSKIHYFFGLFSKELLGVAYSPNTHNFFWLEGFFKTDLYERAESPPSKDTKIFNFRYQKRFEIIDLKIDGPNMVKSKGKI